MRRKTDAPAPSLNPRPLNPRQERFCHAFVYYANGAHAASEAGYTPQSSRKQGYRLLRTARIRGRIRDIQAQLSRDNCRDMDVLLGKLENIYRRAIEDHHFYAAARAVELQAKLTGMAAIKKQPPMIAGDAEPPAPFLRLPKQASRRQVHAVPSGAPVSE